jgi:hypothetical protein
MLSLCVLARISQDGFAGLFNEPFGEGRMRCGSLVLAHALLPAPIALAASRIVLAEWDGHEFAGDASKAQPCPFEHGVAPPGFGSPQ